jgi:hypothetical protein
LVGCEEIATALFTVTAIDAVFVHPFPSVPVTIYVVDVVGKNAVLFVTLLFHV